MVNPNYRGTMMLKDLLEKLKPSSKGKSTQSTTIATPDISRVIKMPKPETATPEAASPPTQDKALTTFTHVQASRCHRSHSLPRTELRLGKLFPTN